jgi:biotin-(acetyl-CoA carboxylase) ligase
VGAALRVIDAQCPGRIGAPFELEGQGAGIDDDGCLLVERADGRVERLESGHVTLP